MGCCYCIQTGSVGLKESFGAFQEELNPGCYCLIPCKDWIRVINKKVQTFQVRCESKTLDDVFVKVQVSVQYQITNAQTCYYQLDEPERQITAYVFDVIRAEVPKQNLAEVFEHKQTLSDAVKHQLGDVMDDYGIKIVATPITDIDPDQKVKDSLNQITFQINLRKAATEKADADAIVVCKLAEAEGERMRITARADAEAKYQSGLGLSRQRKAIVDGLSESVQIFQEGVPGVDARAVMDLIMITQYFDMMEKIGCSDARGCNTLFIPGGSSDASGLTQQLRQGMLEAQNANMV